MRRRSTSVLKVIRAVSSASAKGVSSQVSETGNARERRDLKVIGRADPTSRKPSWKRRLLQGYRWWGFYSTPTRSAIRAILREHIAKSQPRRVLELGGGNGLMKSTLGAGGAYFLCTDIAPSDATDMVIDGCDMPFRDQSFDLVAAFEVLEHVENTDKLLGECSRVVSPGGFLAVSVPFMYGLHDFHDYYRFTPLGLAAKLRPLGFTIVKEQPTTGTFGTIVILFMEWVRQLVIRERKNWRATRGEKLAIAVGALITAPLSPLVWAATTMDRLVDPRPASPVGFIFLAQRDADLDLET